MRFLQSLTKLAALAGLASGASLQPVSNFGDNPTGLQMYIYVPDNVAASPAVIVAVSRDGGLYTLEMLLTHYYSISSTPAEDQLKDGIRRHGSRRTPISSASSLSTPGQPR